MSTFLFFVVDLGKNVNKENRKKKKHTSNHGFLILLFVFNQDAAYVEWCRKKGEQLVQSSRRLVTGEPSTRARFVQKTEAMVNHLVGKVANGDLFLFSESEENKPLLHLFLQERKKADLTIRRRSCRPAEVQHLVDRIVAMIVDMRHTLKWLNHRYPEPLRALAAVVPGRHRRPCGSRVAAGIPWPRRWTPGRTWTCPCHHGPRF